MRSGLNSLECTDVTFEGIRLISNEVREVQEKMTGRYRWWNEDEALRNRPWVGTTTRRRRERNVVAGTFSSYWVGSWSLTHGAGATRILLVDLSGGTGSCSGSPSMSKKIILNSLSTASSASQPKLLVCPSRAQNVLTPFYFELTRRLGPAAGSDVHICVYVCIAWGIVRSWHEIGT